MERPICEVCGTDLIGKSSYDLWIARTDYDQDGEPRKTGEQVDIKNDYVVVGQYCCGLKTLQLWRETMSKLISGG